MNLVGQWPDKTVVTAAHRATRLFEASTQRELPLSSVKNKRLAAFAGIGKPDDFFRTVRDLGADLVHTAALPDHYPLTIELLTSLAQEASEQNPELWLTTEKDWVRLPDDLYPTVWSCGYWQWSLIWMETVRCSKPWCKNR